MGLVATVGEDHPGSHHQCGKFRHCASIQAITDRAKHPNGKFLRAAHSHLNDGVAQRGVGKASEY